MMAVICRPSYQVWIECLLFVLCLSPSLQCPSECICSKWDSVTCMKPLTGFPSNLPSTTIQIYIDGGANSTTYIRRLKKTDLANFTDLQSLTIQNAHLKVVEKDVFEKNGKLRKVELKKNEIEDLDGMTFFATPLLSFLDVSDNYIKEIRTGLLVLRKLSVLSLKNNKILNLSVGMLNELHEVQLLDLSGNNFRYFQPEVFSGMPLLRYLRLNNCSLGDDDVHSDMLKYVENITMIELKDNHISRINRTLFLKVWNLQEIYLDGNDINFIPEDTLSGLRIRHLSLARNNIVSIGIHGFHNFTTETLDLRDNHIASLSPAIFRHMGDSLKKLYLSGNPLNELRGDMFHDLRNVSLLDLSRTNITEIPKDVFDSMNLQYLNISHNRFRVLDNETLGYLNNTPLVDISGGQWECTCHIKELRDWLISNNYSQDCSNPRSRILHHLTYFQNRFHTNCLRCGPYPKVHAGKFLTKLSDADLVKCVYEESEEKEREQKEEKSHMVLILAISMSVLVFLIVIIVVAIIVAQKRRKNSKTIEVQKKSTVISNPSALTPDHFMNGHPVLKTVEDYLSVDAARRYVIPNKSPLSHPSICYVSSLESCI